MKHFLPRVLELLEANEFPCHSDEIVFGRFDLRDVFLWEKEELELLQKFALFYVKRLFIQNDFNLFMADVLVMFGYVWLWKF